MRRKTVQIDSNLEYHVRRPQKKNSCQLKHKTVVRQNTHYQYKVRNQFACSEAVTILLIDDLIEIMETKCRQADEQKYDQMLSSTISILENDIASSFEPIDQEFLRDEVSPNAEEEPMNIVNDCICGGKLVHCERGRAHTKNSSILDYDRKAGHKEGYTSKKTLNSVRSSNNLLKLPKEQHLSSLSLQKRELEALKLPGNESDRFEDMIRDRIFRNTSQGMNNRLKSILRQEDIDKINNQYRQKFLATSNEQYSYDYDGSAIPIRTLPKKTINKVNVLSTTYRFAKENVLNKKGTMTKIQPSACYTQIPEGSKDEREDIKNLIMARKRSALESSNNLKFLPSKDQEEISLRNKFDEMMRNRTIRIRQIRQH